tara:strand:+ start:3058 stop:3321 length:264 start_codon:yes stop_codon:yes gene_type:complete
MDNDEKLIRKAKAKIGFRLHAFVYIVVCLGLSLYDIFFDKTGQNWWYFVVSGWGLGLLSHFIGITSTSLFSVEKEVERLKKDSKNRY